MHNTLGAYVQLDTCSSIFVCTFGIADIMNRYRLNPQNSVSIEPLRNNDEDPTILLREGLEGVDESN